MRNETEWVELVDIGGNMLVGSCTTKILDSVEKVMKMNKKGFDNHLYGNGEAGQIVLSELTKMYS